MEFIGYLIVRKQEYNLVEWEKKLQNKLEFNVYINKLRSVFNTINPSLYKGIDRSPLNCFMPDNYIEKDPALLKMHEILKEKQEASILYADFIDDENAFNSLADAACVYKLLKNKEEYEIIEVRRKEIIETYDFLGFDVGYWGSSHFSIIADTLIMPRWHPVDPNDFNEIMPFSRLLNQNQLFAKYEDVNKFLQYYKTKKWAEMDCPNEYQESQFYIIQVNACRL